MCDSLYRALSGTRATRACVRDAGPRFELLGYPLYRRLNLLVSYMPLAARGTIKAAFWARRCQDDAQIVARTCNVRPQPRLLGTSLLSQCAALQQA